MSHPENKNKTTFFILLKQKVLYAEPTSRIIYIDISKMECYIRRCIQDIREFKLNQVHELLTEVAEPNHKRRIWVGNTFNSYMSKKNTTQQECVPITKGHHKKTSYCSNY
ncbi:hypothetical protein V8G54_005006 [Vigna mungo]|uniref:Uncharacterized protein n=1 Tax=Vigna mungo TaxID=3915 RepID=A0AAQ3SDK8_VIGMU